MSSIKEALIKLGSVNHALRPHIRAILAATPDPARVRVLDIGHEDDLQLVSNLPDGLEVYTYTSRDGKLMMFAVTSRAKKPFSYYYWKSEGERDRAVKEVIDDWNAAVARKQKSKEENRYKGGFNVGDILVSSWGYDQTNVDWYQVVGVSSSTVQIREIGAVRVSNDKVNPNKNKFIGPVLKKRAQGTGKRLYVKINSFSIASLWDGRPMYVTPSGMGH